MKHAASVILPAATAAPTKVFANAPCLIQFLRLRPPEKSCTVVIVVAWQQVNLLRAEENSS